MGMYSKLYEPTQPKQSGKVDKSTSKQVHKTTNQKVDIPTSTQGGKEINPPVELPAKPQAGKRTSGEVGKATTLQVVKYTTHLSPQTIKSVKRYALDTDRKDYEVIQEAVEEYLKRKQEGS